MYIRHSTDGRSNAENPKKGASDVEYSTMRSIESKKSDPTNKVNRIYDIRSDRMHTSKRNLLLILLLLLTALASY